MFGDEDVEDGDMTMSPVEVLNRNHQVILSLLPKVECISRTLGEFKHASPELQADLASQSLAFSEDLAEVVASLHSLADQVRPGFSHRHGQCMLDTYGLTVARGVKAQRVGAEAEACAVLEAMLREGEGAEQGETLESMD
ncbi:hypothetical protein KIPB_002229 [Kipferlia bialata]|uniref:Uncharacterized protein n=1 Tax=Kipferlia bialata TaxID=797122 RepID=A0A9K3CRH2_9EUKA|nr:hypothetical protein KIPB_001017 [Kipferlia bialata]GIQ81291.1 hypothetical protein KIPB_002229 [Kipferlia bialata]|eukprot:g1017.t1